jgi:hypothetical protein
MGRKDSRGEGRMRAWGKRRAERKRLKRQRRLEGQARPPDADPSGAWGRQRGTGAPGSGG